MTLSLAHLVVEANIGSLSLIGLAKNVGKTTTTNFLLQRLLAEQLYRPQELALTSLGLDGESIDALTGLPKPLYVPQPGLLIATTNTLMRQATSAGTGLRLLQELPFRTALGSVMLARVERSGRVIIAGPALLQQLRQTLAYMQAWGARLCIVDGAINRLGAASPTVSDACIVCTGASAAGTPELVARRTAALLARLNTPQAESRYVAAYSDLYPQSRLLKYFPENAVQVQMYTGSTEPASQAQWIVQESKAQTSAYFLRGALTEELVRELLKRCSRPHVPEYAVELVVGDATKIFCHAVLLRRLAACGLDVRVARPTRILALTINPYTPDYVCTPERLLTALVKELPAHRPPLFDVVANMHV